MDKKVLNLVLRVAGIFSEGHQLNMARETMPSKEWKEWQCSYAAKKKQIESDVLCTLVRYDMMGDYYDMIGIKH